MKVLFVIALMTNLCLNAMDNTRKDKKLSHKTHKHHKHHKHHDKLTIYPDVDKKDVHIVLTDHYDDYVLQPQQQQQSLFTRSISTVAAFFRYLNS